MGFISIIHCKTVSRPTRKDFKMFLFLMEVWKSVDSLDVLFASISCIVFPIYFLSYMCKLLPIVYTWQIFLGTVPSWFDVHLWLSVASLILFWRSAFYKLLMIIMIFYIPFCFWNFEAKNEYTIQWVITKIIKAIPNARL